MQLAGLTLASIAVVRATVAARLLASGSWGWGSRASVASVPRVAVIVVRAAVCIAGTRRTRVASALVATVGVAVIVLVAVVRVTVRVTVVV